MLMLRSELIKKSSLPSWRWSMALPVLLAWISESHSAFASETPVDFAAEVRAPAGSVLTLGGAGDSLGNVSSFVASEGSRITLTGKRGAKFVVNVSGDFAMSGAVLFLEGGLLPADVLFKLNSTAPGVLRKIEGNSEFLGCIVANGAPLTISHSTINGRKIAGLLEKSVIIPLLPPPRPRGPVGP